MYYPGTTSKNKLTVGRTLAEPRQREDGGGFSPKVCFDMRGRKARRLIDLPRNSAIPFVAQNLLASVFVRLLCKLYVLVVAAVAGRQSKKMEKLLAALNLPQVGEIRLVDQDDESYEEENDGSLFTIELNDRVYTMRVCSSVTAVTN